MRYSEPDYWTYPLFSEGQTLFFDFDGKEF